MNIEVGRFLQIMSRNKLGSILKIMLIVKFSCCNISGLKRGYFVFKWF